MLIAAKLALFFGVRFERRKVDKKANLHENCNMQKSLLNISAKYHQNRPYNSEVYRFKVGPFFETQCTLYSFFEILCANVQENH